jgi:uncharacterized protein YbcV (DUF1398 family)
MTQFRSVLIRGLIPSLLLAAIDVAHVSNVQAGIEPQVDHKTKSTGDKTMKSTKERIADAYKWAMANLPKVGGYPYLAEALKQAGVMRYVYSLPSGQCIFYASDGKVANQSNVIASGMLEVPAFNKDAFIQVLRKSQNGDITFPEFLKGSWENGVVHYEADLLARKVTYSGADGETYVEDYRAVDLKKPN